MSEKTEKTQKEFFYSSEKQVFLDKKIKMKIGSSEGAFLNKAPPSQCSKISYNNALTSTVRFFLPFYINITFSYVLTWHHKCKEIFFNYLILIFLPFGKSKL